MGTELEFVTKEIEIWRSLDHKNVCKLFEVNWPFKRQIIEDDCDIKNRIFLIAQLCEFG